MTNTLSRREMVATLAAGSLLPAVASALPAGRVVGEQWVKLPTEPYPGKQDDISFAGPMIGWYGNGKGRMYHTADGGGTWVLQWEKTGTFVRAVGFVNEKIGIFGNIGLDDFPDVTDPHPLYRTIDGGQTWSAIEAIAGPVPAGICAIDILRHPFINAGVLNERITIRAGGRVGGPAHLLSSHDLGETWRSRDMSPSTAAILDIHFIDERTGFIAGASTADVDTSNAVVLMTKDGGETWRTVYRSKRPFEITWKLSFPSPRVGYVTVQSYDDARNGKPGVIAKTINGGETWREMPVPNGAVGQQFGIAFLDEKHGWLGCRNGGLVTQDGGSTWRDCDLGPAVNKIRIVREGAAARVFAIGREVHRLDINEA